MYQQGYGSGSPAGQISTNKAFRSQGQLYSHVILPPPLHPLTHRCSDEWFHMSRTFLLPPHIAMESGAAEKGQFSPLNVSSIRRLYLFHEAHKANFFVPWWCYCSSWALPSCGRHCNLETWEVSEVHQVPPGSEWKTAQRSEWEKTTVL